MNMEKETSETTKQQKSSQNLSKSFEAQLQAGQKQQNLNSGSNQGNGFILNGNQSSSINGQGSFVLHNNQSNMNKSEVLKNSKINSQKISNKSIQQSQQNNCQTNTNIYNSFLQLSEQDEIKEDMKKKLKVETFSNHSGSNSGDNYNIKNGIKQQGVINNYINFNAPQNEQILNESANNQKQQLQQQQAQQQQQQQQQQQMQPTNVNQQQQPLLDEQQFRNIQSTLLQLQEQNTLQNQKIQQQHTYQQQIQQMIPELVMLMQNSSLSQNQIPYQNQIQPIQQQNQNQQQIQKANILHAFLNQMNQQQQHPQNNLQPQQLQNTTAQHQQIGVGNIVGQNVFNQGNFQQPQQNNSQVSQILNFLQNNNGNNPGQINNMQEEENQKNMHLISQIQDFYSKIITFEEAQSNMIKELYKKSNHQFELISNVRQEIMQIRESIKINNHTKQQGQQSNQQDLLQIERANLPQEAAIGALGANSLLLYLFNRQDSEYKYELKPYEEIPYPFYRERNFSIKLQLYDRQGNIVQNNNKMILTLALYTSENPPQNIKQNTLGNQILKGFIEKELYQGRVSFDKIQIKEVTSHYLNGWIYLLIFPKHPKESASQSGQGNSSNVDISEIKPLILEKVIVKAKKMREANKSSNQNKSQSLIQKSEENKSSVQSDNQLSHQNNNSNAGSGMRDEDYENDEEDDEIDNDNDNDIENDIDNEEDEDSTNNQNNESSQQKKDDSGANQQQILNLKIEQEKSPNIQSQFNQSQEIQNK